MSTFYLLFFTRSFAFDILPAIAPFFAPFMMFLNWPSFFVRFLKKRIEYSIGNLIYFV